MSLIKFIEYLISPLAMLVVALVFLFLGTQGGDLRFLYFAISIAAWLAFSKQSQKRRSIQAFWPWMIGQFKAKNALGGLGLAGMKISQAVMDPPKHASLDIEIRENPNDPDQWIIRFNNRGWHFLSPILIKHTDALNLLAPDLKQMHSEELKRQFGDTPLNELVSEFKTKEILPKSSTSVIVNKVPGFKPRLPEAHVTFYEVGGDEPFAMRYTVNVNLH